VTIQTKRKMSISKEGRKIEVKPKKINEKTNEANQEGLKRL